MSSTDELNQLMDLAGRRLDLPESEFFLSTCDDLTVVAIRRKAATSLESEVGQLQFLLDLFSQHNDRVFLQGLQTAALALRPKCDPSDFRLIVPAELLAVVQNLPDLQMSEFPDELYNVMIQSKENMLDVMKGLRNTTQQEILKGLGFYVPCHCGVPEPHEPFTPGVCTLEEQLQLAGALAGHGEDMVVELAPEDDDEVAP